MDYPNIKLPIRPAFRNTPVREIKSYFSWFMAEIPIRIGLLERAIVREVDSQWQMTYSRSSLIVVAQFLKANTETRERTDDESIYLAYGPYAADGPAFELTDRTFSLAIDTAMYFAESLRTNKPTLSWGLSLKSKAFADYGHPLLIGSTVTINPVRLMVNLAYGFADGKQEINRILELFDYWSGIAK